MEKQKWTVSQMIAALKETQGMIYLAAKKLGCSHTTVYNYAKRYKSVQAVIDAERGHFVDTTELALKRAVLNGEGWAIAFTLKTLGKKRDYVEKQQVEHSGPDGSMPALNIYVNGLPPTPAPGSGVPEPGE